MEYVVCGDVENPFSLPHPAPFFYIIKYILCFLAQFSTYIYVMKTIIQYLKVLNFLLNFVLLWFVWGWIFDEIKRERQKKKCKLH